jgi:phosphatidylglycerophosphate synthase
MGPVGPLVVLIRDAALVLGVVLMRNSGIDLRVDMAGKISSFLVMAAVGLALLSTAEWIDVVFWIAVILSVATFVNYVRLAAKALRGRGSSTQT